MPARDTSWTTAHPRLLTGIARVLGLDEATVASHSHVEGDVVHAWTPGRGGAQLVAGLDGSIYVRESSHTAAALRVEYAQGARTDPDRLAARPINHAASAVVAMLERLRGTGSTSTAGPTGPEPAELARIFGGRLGATTPEEIEAVLRAAGTGTYALVGVDREVGPGHWYIAHIGRNAGETEDQVNALDPIANTMRPWPPANADAVRWWATGVPASTTQSTPSTPSTPPATVTCVAQAHGHRIWLDTTAGREKWGQMLVDAWARQPADRVQHGKGLWFGFWWTSIHAVDDGFRVSAANLAVPENDKNTWNVDAALDALYQQQYLCDALGIRRQSVNFLATITVETAAWDTPAVHLVRREPTSSTDSGWYVGVGPEPSGPTETLEGRDVHRRRPELVRYLGLPPGYRATWSGSRTERVVAADGRVRIADGAFVQDGAGTQQPAAQQPPAPAQPAQQPAQQPSQPARRSGHRAYDEASDAIADRGASAERLLAAGHGLRDAFARFDHGIGLLPPDALEVMLTAYRRADAAGSEEAAWTWVRRAYFERVASLERAAAARVELLAYDDPSGDAHVLRGWMRFNGYGFPPDPAAVLRDHTTAAERGNADAHFELAVLLGSGQGGVPVDADRSRQHLRAAVDLDHPRALHNLAVGYATGQGAPFDLARALDLYRRAAERGHQRAAFTAGVMTLTGQGTRADEGRAADLFGLAEDLGLDVREEAGHLPPELRDLVLRIVD
ncbi:tetratricopeptide repeat protein [Nocardioides zeae]|uniref:Tetratricopeptide repeat protein n=1 Tax=Nocardioides imazamoxiresistens TaxID=3231893 RepID=A0ABU3PWX0_9ACTN|nr:tetratricopeptide repeat protein [Nocardioides zeae]MDT9593735.1 tetratricopeptide repeat protein [Nocardioides zeae]